MAILIRRNASEQERVWINDDLLPTLHGSADRHSRLSLAARGPLGAILAVGGLFALTRGTPSRTVLQPVGGVLLVMAAIVVIFGPWWLSLVRDLLAERQARARAEERAQIASHVHDSVLQTLALIQRSADDPQHVVRLAAPRTRAAVWLFEGRPPRRARCAYGGEGVSALQRQVEADHRVTVQAVVVGDRPLTDALRALLDAAREATVNAAKWSRESEVSLYAEVEADAVMLTCTIGATIRPGQRAADRQGIAQSIRPA